MKGRKWDIWRMQNGRWGAEVSVPQGDHRMGVGVRDVSLRAALWHLLTCRRPDEWALTVDSTKERQL
jgi:hypothetical protein